MKEFYLYTLRQSYIDKFSRVEPRLSELKGTTRPCMCVKLNGYNWLLPVTSLDPLKPNFATKKEIIESQQSQEKNLAVKAIFVTPDISGRTTRLKTVICFYYAIPVKSEYVVPYISNGSHTIADYNGKLLSAIKTNLTAYLRNYSKGKPSGFLVVYHKNNPKTVGNYQLNSKKIGHELYKKHFIEATQRKERARLRVERLLAKVRHKELKYAYLGINVAQKNAFENVATTVETIEKNK